MFRDLSIVDGAAMQRCLIERDLPGIAGLTPPLMEANRALAKLPLATN
jgi:hypothetical protein